MAVDMLYHRWHTGHRSSGVPLHRALSLWDCRPGNSKGTKGMATSIMTMTSNGTIFCVTAPLCGEFTGHRWIPLTKASDVELWWFSLICAWMTGWVNNWDASDMRCHRAHYDITEILRDVYFNSLCGNTIKSVIFKLIFQIYIFYGIAQCLLYIYLELTFLRVQFFKAWGWCHFWPLTPNMCYMLQVVCSPTVLKCLPIMSHYTCNGKNIAIF